MIETPRNDHTPEQPAHPDRLDRVPQARLLNEGLPAFRQALDNAKGRRIRVRVGPYASRAQADAAAETIRAMALEAVVFKQ